jgi:hypothetical protein
MTTATLIGRLDVAGVPTALVDAGPGQRAVVQSHIS